MPLNSLVTALIQKFSGHPTEELLQIWVTNDRLSYSSEAFLAIEQLLLARGIAIPLQNNAPTLRLRAKAPSFFYTGMIFFLLSIPFGWQRQTASHAVVTVHNALLWSSFYFFGRAIFAKARESWWKRGRGL